MSVIFKASWLMTLVALATISLCIKLGFWQYDKALAKQSQQLQLDTRQAEKPISLLKPLINVESLRYKRVKVQGTYHTDYQIFLDNQVQNTVAGYQVITPLQIQGTQQFVLINRGWVKGPANRQVPNVITPGGIQKLEGDISLPADQFFTLEAPIENKPKWQPVWQNLDIQRYVRSVPFYAQPYIVRMDAKSNAGGFVRNWPVPGERVTKHLGYAYQWFGFALTIFVIYIVLNIKKVEQ